ncbi:hypothetical protein HNQ57_002549 [Zhongshania antarctica]|uniref:Uncharacterized protein n=1 Tax=Zhongshania antarctica TaxID=641702 RepID=A0A840R7B1_9GAMM|nr:hypothetical protein [Zhongshania antarctica]
MITIVMVPDLHIQSRCQNAGIVGAGPNCKLGCY